MLILINQDVLLWPDYLASAPQGSGHKTKMGHKLHVNYTLNIC